MAVSERGHQDDTGDGYKLLLSFYFLGWGWGDGDGGGFESVRYIFKSK